MIPFAHINRDQQPTLIHERIDKFISILFKITSPI